MTTTLLHRRAAAIALAVATMALVTGCVSAPDRPPTLLTLPAPTTGAPAPVTAPPRKDATLAIARLDIPEYLVSRRVRYRTDGSTLAEWPDTFWAERIEVGMSREFASALRARLPGWRLCESQCAEWSPVAGLRVVIDRMDYSRVQRQLKASARVAVVRHDTDARSVNSQRLDYEVKAEADTPQAQAQAYADLLDRLATDAAAAVAGATALAAPATAAPAGR
jgi:uncharacterized lipoprotein YmbA